MLRLKLVGPCWALLVLLCCSLFVVAQSITGTIIVVATDSSGAVINDASVLVRNSDTNITRSITTNSEGRALIQGLPVGPYEVTIEKPGFGKILRSGIILQLNQDAVVNATLRPTAVSETVVVTEDAPLLNTTSSEVGVRFDEKRLSDLPTNGLGALGGGFRDVFSFGLSVPGVSQINQGNTGFAGGTNYSVNGQRLRSNNFTLDGQDVNDPSVSGVQQKFNNPDAIQEFRMITNQFAAEYGHSAGSVVNVVTKSGTNKMHGSAFWFHNDNTMNTRSNLDKATQIGTGIDKQPLRIENQIGGTLGGPIKKNKTFFFGSLQRWSNRQLGSGSTISGAPTDVGRAALQSNGGDRAQVQALLKYLPQAQTAASSLAFYCFNGGAPTVTGKGLNATATCPSGKLVNVPVGSITGATRQLFNDWQWSGKVDHQLNAKNSLSGRYLFDNQINSGSGQATPTGLSNVNPQRSQVATVGLSTILTQRLLNEGRLSWSRAASRTGPQDPAALLIPSIEIADLGLNGFNAVATRTAIGYGVNLPQSRRNDIYQLQENMTYNRGTHTYKFGIDFRYQDLASDFNPNVRGQLRYSSLHNYVADTADVTSQINKPLPGGQLVVYYSWFDYYFFAQDTWKVTPTFTLNYGLRYELPGNPVDNLFRLNDRILSANGGNTVFRYNSRPAQDKNNVQPRFGFNWNPQTENSGILGAITGGNKLVLRGGYSLAFDYPFLNMLLNISSAFPFQAAFNTVGQPNNFATLQSQVLNPANALKLNQTRVRNDFRSPYAHQFSLELERALGVNDVVKLGYVGTKGTALFQSVEGNPTTRCFPVPSAGCPRLDPTQGVIRVRANAGSSIYHSLQASVDHRFSHGLTGGAHYTFSSFIDDASEVFNPSSGEVATAQDPFSKVGERARSTYDRPHRLTGNMVYELPFYKNETGVAGHALGGWQIGTLMTFQSGSPFTVLNGVDPGKVLLGSLVGNAIRPNLNTNLDLRSMSLADIIKAGGATLWSALPSNGSIPTGNSPRNLLRGDGLVSVDASIAKNTRIIEGHTLQFRADMFNLPNHRNFGIPAANINAPAGTFLNEQTTDGGNRRIFLSLRYLF